MFNFSKTVLTEDDEVKPLAAIDTEKHIQHLYN